MDSTIRTGVDEFLDYLEGKDKVSLLDAARDLKLSLNTLQSWVDFLVDEGILGIEYKFTKPFIYLNKESETKTKAGQQKLSYEVFKQEFLNRAKEKQIPEAKALSLWNNNLLQQLDFLKSFFYQEANIRKINDIDGFWERYKTSVMVKSS